MSQHWANREQVYIKLNSRNVTAADMEVNEKHNVNMIKFVLLCLFMSCAKGRIHKLKLEVCTFTETIMSLLVPLF